MKRGPKKATQNSGGSVGNLRPWKPGQSGNPGGRPKAVKELLELARSEVPASFDLAVKLRDDEQQDSRVRLEAAKFLTAYGLGAPPKEPPKDDTEDMTDEQLEREVARVMSSREERGPKNGTPSRSH